MQEPVQHREIGFADLFRIIFKKFYVIVIAVVLAAALGATYAYSKNNGISYYGATTDYKISVTSMLYVDDKTDNSDEPVPYGEPSGYNYLYKEEHLSMLIDDLRSDKFIRDYIMEKIEGFPSYNPDASDAEANNYYNLLLSIKGCISYSYNAVRNPNAISATVRVLNNKELAQKLFEQISEAVPQYITENMIKPAPETTVTMEGTLVSRVYTTHCTEMSMSRIRLLNGGQAQSAMLRYAVLAGFLAAVITCIAVIVMDYTDTRLRDPEDFAKRNDIRLLGAIPEPEKLEIPNLPQQNQEVNV